MVCTKDTWVIIDSGIGGLAYADFLKNAYPHKLFIYIADNLNFPYGEKSKESLKILIKNLLTKIVKSFNPEVIIFACNTATSLWQEEGNSSFLCDIRGVYPFIEYQNKAPSLRTFLFSTEGTLKSNLIQNFLRRHSSHIKGFALPSLVKFSEIRSSFWKKRSTEEILKIQNQYKDWNVQAIYLGCTHFIELASWLRGFYPDVHFLDSRLWLVKSLSSYCLTSTPFKERCCYFYVTKEDSNRSYYLSKANEYQFMYKGLFT